MNFETLDSVENFEKVDLASLAQREFDHFYRFRESQSTDAQIPLFREHELPAAIVKEHWEYRPPPDINIYAATGCVLGGGGFLLQAGKLWLPRDCYPGYFATFCQQAGGKLPGSWVGALGAGSEVIYCQSACACPLHPNQVYGHFLLEMLPRLYLLGAIRDLGVQFKLALDKRTQRFIRAFVALYFDESDIVWYDGASQVVSAPLFLVPSMLHENHNFHPLFNAMVQDLLARAGPAGAAAAAPAVSARRVYLSRSRLARAWHKLTNEPEVEETFSAMGFAVVHPQELTLHQQLHIYANAEFLAGQYGSALHNSLFAAAGTKVLALNRINWYQSMIGRLRQQELAYVTPADGFMRDWRMRDVDLVEYEIDCRSLKEIVPAFVEERMPEPRQAVGSAGAAMAKPTSIYENDAAIRDGIAKGWHRGMIGDAWEELGQLQAAYLISEGLRPEHRFIDVGSGPFRAGVKLIPYLEPNHYFAIDSQLPLLEIGYEKEIKPTDLAGRFPRSNFAQSTAFDVRAFGVLFDYGIAQSVFTHMPIDRLADCLGALGPCFRPGGRFYVTLFLVDPAEAGRGVHHPRGGIVSSPDRDPFHTTIDKVREVTRRAPGWEMLVIGDWQHPRSEQMIRFTRTG